LLHEADETARSDWAARYGVHNTGREGSGTTLMAYQTPLTIKETLEKISQRSFVLPAIQRELVWAQEPERMTKLFDSLLRGYPIGTFLFWRVTPENSRSFHFYEFMREWHELKQRHNERLHVSTPRELTAILDGQQRLTSLNVGLYGSLAHKLPNRRRDSAGAYPEKRLFVDLKFEPSEDDDVHYRFEFLTDEQARRSGESHWYRVGDILDLEEPGEPVYDYVERHALTGNRNAFRVLSRLWKAVHEDGVVSYFEEKQQDLSKVLDIFVRVNSGGVALTKSDLLLSIATAQFTLRDAREEIHRLVDDLNATQPGFKITKDLVLKAGLVLTDISDIGFRVESFTADNMKILDSQWEDVEDALRTGVHLLASFGFSESTLPASSVLIPLADYIHSRGLTSSYVTSAVPAVRADRERVRSWTIRTILRPGVWGSGLDGLLRSLHQCISETSGAFPLDAIETAMARRGKSLAFDDALIDDLLDTPYKHKRMFALQTLLYDWVDPRNQFHIDHIFPRSLSTAARLRAQGVSASAVDDIRDKVERLANLQLMSGPENSQKRAQLPATWAREHFPDAAAREAWLAGHDLHGIPEDFHAFLGFYERRRSILRRRLVELLGGYTRDGATHNIETRLPRPTKPQALEDSRPRTPSPPLPGWSGETAPPAPPRYSPLYGGASKRSYGVGVSDLLALGRLQPGATLRGRYHGQTISVTVSADGRLEAGGKSYSSPSAAAVALTHQPSANGWIFWHTEDGTRIADLRPGFGT